MNVTALHLLLPLLIPPPGVVANTGEYPDIEPEEEEGAVPPEPSTTTPRFSTLSEHSASNTITAGIDLEGLPDLESIQGLFLPTPVQAAHAKPFCHDGFSPSKQRGKALAQAKRREKNKAARKARKKNRK